MLKRLLKGFVLCMTLWMAQADAGPTSPALIACSLPLPPHTMPDEHGQPTGYATEILQAVAQQLGWAIEIRYMPWLRVVYQARQGHCDLVYTVLKRPDYEDFLIFPQEPVQRRANVLVVLKKRGIRFDGDLESFMRRHSIGLYRDKAVDARFEQWRHAPWARVDEASDARLNLMKLVTGRFDAAIENEMTAVYELNRMGQLPHIEILSPSLNEVPAYVAFPKLGRLAKHAEDFDRAMITFRRTSAYRALQTRYGAASR